MTGTNYVVANIAYGTGPYIRITELALRINNKLEANGEPRCRLVLPWIYGEKQKRIVQEEFGEHLEEHPDELILDETLGEHYQKILYRDEPFSAYLGRWVEHNEQCSATIQSYLRSEYGDNIRFELGRAPRIEYDLSPSYYTSFGKLSRIFDEALGAQQIPVPASLLREAGELCRRLEQGHEYLFVSEPGTFASNTGDGDQAVERVPPLSTPPEQVPDAIAGTGIYVTVSGISGLETLYEQAAGVNHQLYSNDSAAVPASRELPPWVVANEKIEWHFARPGWGSIWLSIFTETPLLVPAWDENDDPEMYFNIRRLEELGIATVYEGQSFEELADFKRQAPERMRHLKDRIRREHGTLDGIELVAQTISRHLLKG